MTPIESYITFVLGYLTGSLIIGIINYQITKYRAKKYIESMTGLQDLFTKLRDNVDTEKEETKLH